MKGLVLEGGGLRGVFTAGVIDVFLEKGIEFDTVTGVSAGACHSCSYLAKQRGRALSVCIDYLDNPEYCSFRSLVKTGNMFGEQFVFHDIPEKLYPVDNEEFKKSRSSFYVSVTDCVTGKAYYPKINDLFEDVEWIRASSSLPLVSKFVYINGKPYLDGGIADSVPIEFSINSGNDKNVVVLTRDRSYRKKPEKMFAAMRLKYSRYPELLDAIKHRHEKYNDALDLICKLEKEGKIFVIAPEVPLAIGRTEKNKEKLELGYKLGRKAALVNMKALKDYLEG
ncbi:MAG: patatin family protein [Clostridia bacterium]|nr:patatin family protein [Clostridia bacterium]